MRLGSLHGLVALSTAALVGVLLAPMSASAGEAGDPGAVLDQQTSSLTTADRGTGLPIDGDPGHQLAAASVQVDLHPDDTRDWLKATVDLVGVSPTDTENGRLLVGYGHISGSTCAAEAISLTRTEPGVQRFETLDWVGEEGYGHIGDRPDRPFDCVAVALQNAAGTTYDALIGEFTNSYLSPRIETGEVTLLGGREKRLRLVKGVWTRYVLAVKNTGDHKIDQLRH